MRFDVLAAMNGERAARRACVLVTEMPGGEQRFVKAADLASDPLAEILEASLRTGKSGMVEHEGRSYFLTVQAPPARLIVIGAVHITQALAPMARVAGFDLTIIDPRTAFAGERPLHPGLELPAAKEQKYEVAKDEDNQFRRIDPLGEDEVEDVAARDSEQI